MSLKKKSKSLGHLTALAPAAPVAPTAAATTPSLAKKQLSSKSLVSDAMIKFLGGGGGGGQGPAAAAAHTPPMRSSTALNLGTPMSAPTAGQSKPNTPKVRLFVQ